MVRADHYFNLYNQANGLPFNLVLSPKTVIKSGAAASHPELATDGTPATHWTSSEAGKQWLELDFGGIHRISRYVIRHAGASGVSRDFNPRGFVVQVRVNDGSWAIIDVIKGNTGDVTDVGLDPVNARIVRIAITDAGADATARISEVEIFGRPFWRQAPLETQR